MTTDEECCCHTAGVGAGRAIAILGGILLCVAVFLPWYAVGSLGPAGHLSGIDLSALAPELGILPALGLACVLGGALLGRTPRSVRESRVPAFSSAVVGAIGIIVTFEVGARIGGSLQNWYGTAFWGAAGLGWYVAVLGGFLVLGAGLLRMLVPRDH